MPVMLVVFDEDGMPLDVKGVEVVDPEFVAGIGALLWRVSGEIGDALGERVDRIRVSTGTLTMDFKFGVEAGYAVVIDHVAIGLSRLEEAEEATA